MAVKFGGFTDQQREVLARRMGFAGPMEKFGEYLQSSPEYQNKFVSYENKARQLVEGQAPPVPRFKLGGDVKGALRRAPLDIWGAGSVEDQIAARDAATGGSGSGNWFGDQAAAAPAASPPSPISSPAPTPTDNSQQQTAVGQVASSGQARDLAVINNPAAYTPQVTPTPIQTQPNQFIDPSSGQAAATPNVTAAQVAPTAQAGAVAPSPAPQVTTASSTPAVASATEGMKSATATLSSGATGQAQTQDPRTLAQLGMTPEQIAQAQKVAPTPPRVLNPAELVSGSAVDMAAVNSALDVQAAQAMPSKQATVQGQLDSLMQTFEATAPPPWAAGAMRAANAQLAARGLGASSMAGQAVVQAAMESALPIAMADAQTFAGFEAQNLSNRQQVTMFAAQQRAQFLGQEFDQKFQTRVFNATRIAEIADLNFTAEQQVALENARLAQSVDLANLDVRSAKMLSDAAALSQMDMTNLSNRQQMAVQNAQAFLQRDLAQFDADQQTTMFKSQSLIQALFTDQAAENASRQFNATSQGQTDQFFANLKTQVQQFNVAQTNAMEQFKAGQTDSVSMFNRQMNDAREQFNAANRLVVDQSNAEWRRAVTTADNASINEANRINATNASAMTQAAYNNLMQRERDFYSFAFTAGENNLSRANELALAQLGVNSNQSIAKQESKSSTWAAVGSLAAALITKW